MALDEPHSQLRWLGGRTFRNIRRCSLQSIRLTMVRRFLSFMPQNVHELPPHSATSDKPSRVEEELVRIIPRDRGKPYKMPKFLSG